MSKRGTFITFEGGDGAGKTTQIALLAESLRQAGEAFIVTREPGGCPEAELMRNIVLHRDELSWRPESHVLLMTAARVEHLAKVIAPALAAGKAVICDRFFDSTLAYQGYGMGVPLEAIRAVHDAMLGGFQPDITFVLDIDPSEGLKRARVRSNKGESKIDVMENRDIHFHQRLREGFLAIAAAEPERVIVIDAHRTVENMHEQICALLGPLMGASL